MKLLIKHILEAAFLGCLLFFNCFESVSQERFSIRDTLNFNNTGFTGVIESSNSYLVTGGSMVLEEQEYNPELVSGIFTLEGDLLSASFFQKEFGTYTSLASIGLKSMEGLSGYYTGGITYDENSDSEAGFVVLFDEDGDTLFTKLFDSPYLEIDDSFGYIVTRAIVKSNSLDDSFFISSSIFLPGLTGNDCVIQKMNTDGDILWEYVYASNVSLDVCYAIYPLDNGGVLAIIRRFGDGNVVVVLDSDSTLLYEGDSDIEFTVNDIIGSIDDNFIIGVGLGEASDGFATGQMFKMNFEGDTLWSTEIGQGQDLFFQNQFYRVVHSDDNAYVAGGTKKEFLEKDEISPMTGNTRSHGWLVKIDDDGEVIWERKYYYLNAPQDRHQLHDLKATSDGGYIFCGEATDEDLDQEFTFNEGPRQQGWLVKVDEYGCLVAGCQLSDNISVLEKEIEYFKAGPIPTGQFLNIYQSENTTNSGIYSLCDLHGKEVETFPTMSKGTTMMLDIGKYSHGSYILSLTQEGKLLQQKKIIFN